MNELHLFAGAGGGILGGILCGHTTICAVEIEPYCRQVMLQRQRDGILPKFPIWDDVCTFDGKPWRGNVDIICGGFPCQDLSSQSAVHHGMQGLDGSRSGLWVEFARVIGEIRPRFVLVENSPNLIVRGLDRVLGDLAQMGYNARWGVLGADSVGLDHKRDRFWLVAKKTEANDVSDGLQGGDYGNKKGQGRSENRPVARLCKNQLRFDIPAPDAFGGPNGMANRVERTKAIGNGQVPAVARLAWDILTKNL